MTSALILPARLAPTIPIPVQAPGLRAVAPGMSAGGRPPDPAFADGRAVETRRHRLLAHS
jgi:hypothetical protein